MNGPKNKIGWCDYTWNVISGCDGNAESDCYKYCYARIIYERFGWSFKPTYHPERLNEPYKVKEPSRIFVCSVSDFFAKSTKQEWFNKVWKVMLENYRHKFLLLTKCPENIPDQLMAKNIWIGTTITKQNELHRLKTISKIKSGVRFVSFEPLLENIYPHIEYDMIDWVIIGAQTGCNSTPINPIAVKSLIVTCKLFNIPVYVKDNVKFCQEFKEFPKI